MKQKSRNKGIAICLAAMMLFSTVFSSVEIAYASENVQTAAEGSIEADLQISTARELKEFATKVNNGNSYAGKVVELTADIEFDGVTINNFTPIGYSNYSEGFQGIFNGNGHTISGIIISDFQSAGLFGLIGNDAIVKNVTLKNCEFSGYGYIGGVAARSNGVIDNCRIESTIIETSTQNEWPYIGGIVGDAHGIVKNCISDAEIVASRGSVGGIVGDGDYVIINNCANHGNVTVSWETFQDKYVGGILGYDSQRTTIQNSYNTGVIMFGGNAGAGIAGSVYTASNCYTSEESSDVNFIEITTERNCKAYPLADMKTNDFLAKLNANRGTNYDWFEWVFKSEVSEFPVHTDIIKFSDCAITLDARALTYDGTEKKPTITVKYGGKTLLPEDEYTVEYQNNINAGTATAIITGIGKYDGSVTKSFTISPANMNSMNITLLESEFNYTGYGHEPNFLAMHGEREMDYWDDFDYSYQNNINAGTGKLVLTGKGNYTGTVIKYFTIKPISITDATASLYTSYFTYSGNAFYPGASVTVNRKALAQGTDFKITHVNNINAGTATATITGMGNYTGSITRYFYIYAKSIANTNISLSKTKYNYDGKAKKPTVTVKDGTKKLTKGTDYTVTYSNNKKIGTATVTITGKGNYAGTLSKTFTINAKKDTTFESGSYQYKVTGSNTVAFVGVKKSKISKTTTVKVADTVKYGGKTFKVTSIADKALYKNTKVKSVTIGKNVTTIGKNAFNGCKKLKAITVKSTKIKSVGKNALKGIHKKATIKVPSKKYSTYNKKTFKGKGQAKTVTIKK